MRVKSIRIGIVAMLVIAAIFYILKQDIKQAGDLMEQEHLLIIEDSILENLTDAEIEQLQRFAVRALNVAEKPMIYSPHAKYLENGAILTYMMFVNKSSDTIRDLHSLNVTLFDRDYQTIASGIFLGNIYNMPAIEPENAFLFALIFDKDSVHIPHADLSSYITETMFDYISISADDD